MVRLVSVLALCLFPLPPRVRKLAASADPTVRSQAESLLREGLFWEKRMIESAEALEREWKEKQKP